jgi:tetratricopeptide (TPR) repeat protein
MKLTPVCAFLSMACTAAAQAPPADLSATMQTIAAALGVSCGYCHSAERGSGQPEPKKDIARAMMAMTRDINAKVQAAAGKPAAEVQCITCHRGVAIPRQLSEIVSQTIKEKGTDAAIAQYRELRTQYFGRQAYDFGEGTLVALAQQISNSKPTDAIALLQVNLEFNPRSAATYAAIAFAYTRKLDDDSAIVNLEKALEIEPENGIFRGQLEQLKGYQRARQRR